MSPAKELEKAILERLEVEERAGRCCAGRYGVQATMRKNERGELQWQPVPSMPDIEGVLQPDGRQFMTDAKCCGQASQPLHDSHVAERQLRHMRRRSKMGAVCFFTIHWTERMLKTRTEPAETWAFPVIDDHPFWQAFDRGEVKAIRRDDCYTHGVRVSWNTLPGERKPRPDVLAAVLALAAMLAPTEVFTQE